MAACVALMLADELRATEAVKIEPGEAWVEFNRDIRPLFLRHCAACHGGVKQAGDISFVYESQVLPPDGWVVEPGDPDASILIDRVSSDDPDYRMPPAEHGPPLSDEEVDLLRRWIAEGARWEQHWAFTAPKRAAPPQVNDRPWCRQPVDPFILQELERRNFAPAQAESSQRWLRRVSLDLIGLPPTPEQTDVFVQEAALRGEAAYEAVVDRLLASPHFGERWAVMWLDLMRYADSEGLGADRRRDVWKYRDWVIQALNDDMPYDQFTIKQLAGDLLDDPTLEDLVATTAQRLTQTNTEGGTNDEEFRVQAVLDRVNATWQAWQGTTFACVQCHSHPYDEFRHDEYYRFAAFFNNTADCDLVSEAPKVSVPLDDGQYAEARELDRQIAELWHPLWERQFEALTDPSRWSHLKDLEATTSNETKVAVGENDGVAEFRTVGTVARNTDIACVGAVPRDVTQVTAVRLTITPQDVAAAVSNPEWGFVLSHFEAELIAPGAEPQKLEFVDVVADEPEPHVDPQGSLDPTTNWGFAAYTQIHYPRQAAFVLAEPMPAPAGSQLRVRLKHRVMEVAAFPLISKRGSIAVTADESLITMRREPQVAEAQAKVAELRKERAAIPATSVPIMRERPPHLARPTHVFTRGFFLDKAEQVEPGVPRSMPELGATSPTRLDMARWLVRRDNPLTARVQVNRIWARLFDRGIVATEDDFGTSGEPASHPELLDDLAVRFQDDYQWSQKKLIRELVLSSTYRQSNAYRPDVAEVDPANRWLARGPRRRLAAEFIRDQSLAIAGLLSDKMFGPPVHPPLPEGVWKPFHEPDKWTTEPRGDEDRYRRSIYTYTKRSIPFPSAAAFDAPTREFCTSQRLPSTTPLQALMLLNDEGFAECATALAGRMAEHSSDAKENLRYGFRLAVCRSPRDAELRELQRYYEEAGGEDSPREALELVASVLLNLDEVLTK